MARLTLLAVGIAISSINLARNSVGLEVQARNFLPAPTAIYGFGYNSHILFIQFLNCSVVQPQYAGIESCILEQCLRFEPQQCQLLFSVTRDLFILKCSPKSILSVLLLIKRARYF